MKRKLRLSHSRDIRRVYGARRARSGELLTVHTGPSRPDGPRFAFAVSTKVGGAVVRNRLRRQLRAAASEAVALAPAADIVVVARPAAAAAGYAQLAAELRDLLGGAGPARGHW